MLATLLAAAEKPQPLIDIDATVFLQFAIFCVMAVVLTVFVFRPYLRMKEQRGGRIDGARKDAKAMQERSVAMMNDYEAQLMRARQRGAEERARLRREGQAHEGEVLGRAREIGSRAMQEAQARANKQRDDARTKLRTEASTLGSAIAARILGRQP